MSDAISKLMAALYQSKTAYHAAAYAAHELEQHGFCRLEEGEQWSLIPGGKYYVLRDGSSMIAFCLGQQQEGFHVVASHVDSPCLKVKGKSISVVGGCAKLNVERYGGSLLYSWLDIPLCLAGRAISYEKESGRLVSHLVEEPYKLVIPSLAIHFNPESNKGLTLNPQIDLQPIASLDEQFQLYSTADSANNILERDMFLVNAAEPYLAGFSEELLVSPRIDNLTSVFASVAAICHAGDDGISMIYLADHEEVGSKTKQGAGSDFLRSVMLRVSDCIGQKLENLLPHSFMLSCDNAHATHPNHPEKSDLANSVKLGGGVVIKHHANQNYTTDAFSAAIFKAILDRKEIPYQDFYMRADMPCGGTLGAISSSQVSIRSVDIGLPQLAMHAATETMCVEDYMHLLRALEAFFSTSLHMKSYQEVICI